MTNNHTNPTSDLVAITTWVPARHVMHFQTQVAGLLAQLGDDSSHTEPTDDWPIDGFTAATEFPTAWDYPHWSDDDGDRAAWVMARVDLRRKSGKLLRALVTLPNGISGQDLADATGMPPSSVPASFGGLSTYTRRVRRRPMWEAERLGGVRRYTMEPPARRLFGGFGDNGGGDN